MTSPTRGSIEVSLPKAGVCRQHNAQVSGEDMTGGTPHSLDLFQPDGRATGTHARYLDQTIQRGKSQE